ncbi:MAG: 2OG-Fe(II) oxygenase [Parvularculaceae bacterium]
MNELADLKAQAEKGDAAAQYRLAAVLDRAGDRKAADVWLDRAAAAHYPAALYSKAVGLLEKAPTSVSAAEAARLLKHAAEGGNGAAGRRLAVLKALGLGTDEDWAGAVALVEDAAASGRPDAAREMKALRAVSGAPKVGSVGAGTVRREAPPRLIQFSGALSAFECEYVMNAAGPLLRPSAVADPALGAARTAQFRTSDGAALGLLALDLPLIAIWRKLCAMAGAPPGHSELMGVLRYRPGEEYRPHHDYLPEDAVDYSDVRRAGQRRATLLTPLSAAYEGGETVFPRLGLRFRLAAGDSLLFENTADGEPIADSLHAGEPVASGEKWMLTLWLREKRFWFWP